MKSSVTTANATSVTSILCLAISDSSRSNGPEKFSRRTSNPGRVIPGAAVALASGSLRSGDVATVDQLAGQLAVVVGTGVIRRIGGDRLSGHRSIGELHRAGDHRLEDLGAEGLLYPGQHLSGVQGARIEHGGQDSVGVQAR